MLLPRLLRLVPVHNPHDTFKRDTEAQILNPEGDRGEPASWVKACLLAHSRMKTIHTHASAAKATPSRNRGGTRYKFVAFESRDGDGDRTSSCVYCAPCTVRSLLISLAVPAFRLASEARRHHPRPTRSVDRTARASSMRCVWFDRQTALSWHWS